MPRKSVPEPGEVTGSASCPDEVQELFNLGFHRGVALKVCGRICAREMMGMGHTPPELDLASDKPCGESCKEARILYPPNGVISRPDVAELPQPEG